jgi:septum formation protein
MHIEFEVKALHTDESFPESMDVQTVAVYLARKKAEAFQDIVSADDLVICADTTVIFDGKILEKPQNREEACAMLQTLSGNTHVVITGVCILSNKQFTAFDEHTKVRFTQLSSSEIETYVDRCQPYDKAGAYGIQEWIGALAVERIEGSYTSVMGLPTCRLYQELKKMGAV